VQAATMIEATEMSRMAPASGFLDTYGATYAFGSLFLLPAILLIGSQPLYSFNAFYVAMLTIPPIAASVCLLATAPGAGERRNLLGRSVLLVVVATTASILALVAGTPVVIFLFVNHVGHSQAATGLISTAGLAVVSAPMVWSLVNHVGHSQAATGLISTAGLAVVSAPMVWSLVNHVRAGAWVRVGVLLMAVFAMVVVVALTLSRGGFLVDSMRPDQGQIMMGLLEWCLPAFAVTAAYLKRSDVV